MERKEWAENIKKACENIGTYKKEFDPVIDTLADILETRDKALEQFRKSGGNPIVSHTNKGGATNLAKNPLLVIAMDLNTQALAYWRDLGLTPAGLKKLNGEITVKKDASLSDVLKDLGL